MQWKKQCESHHLKLKLEQRLGTQTEVVAYKNLNRESVMTTQQQRLETHVHESKKRASKRSLTHENIVNQNADRRRHQTGDQKRKRLTAGKYSHLSKSEWQPGHPRKKL